MLNRLKCILLIATVVLSPVMAVAAPKLSPAQIGGKAFILIEADSNITLAQQRATERLAPASITKLMTAYVIYQSIERGILSLDDKTLISQRARSMGGSRMFLERGSLVSINDLLSGLVIQSGNDAAVALAEAVAGDEARFVEVMNQQAQALGMKDSQFRNVTGLPDDAHFMSARDIATLSLAIIRDFPEHYKRYSQRNFTWNNITQENRNALLRSDPSVDGLKTGHTDAAGYCLTTSAKRGDMRLVSVVLGTESTAARARASEKLLAFGFNQFKRQTLYQAGQTVTQSPVKNGKVDQVSIATQKTITLPLPKNNPVKGLQAQLVLKSALVAPISQQSVIGHFNILRDGKILATVPAITAERVEEIGWFSKVTRWLVSGVKDLF